jgi:hypothetical protein
MATYPTRKAAVTAAWKIWPILRALGGRRPIACRNERGEWTVREAAQ